MTVQHAHEIVLSPDAYRLALELVVAAWGFLALAIYRTVRFLDR